MEPEEIAEMREEIDRLTERVDELEVLEEVRQSLLDESLQEYLACDRCLFVAVYDEDRIHKCNRCDDLVCDHHRPSGFDCDRCGYRCSRCVGSSIRCADFQTGFCRLPTDRCPGVDLSHVETDETENVYC